MHPIVEKTTGLIPVDFGPLDDHDQPMPIATPRAVMCIAVEASCRRSVKSLV
jgi:hypothetical protein